VFANTSGGTLTNARFYNNAIINMGPGISSRTYCVTTCSGNISRNNLWYNSANATASNFDSDYNYYINTTHNTGEPNRQTTPTSDPFTAWTTFDFHLVANTNAGANLGSPYNTDGDGVVRSTWSRGAYEFVPVGSGGATGYVPSSLSFGESAVGYGTAAQTITLTNVGSAPLTITSITATGANAADFHLPVSASPCPISPSTLAVSGTCIISVYFNPGAAGARSGSVTVTSNAASSPDVLALTGTGVTKATTSLPVFIADNEAPRLSVKCPTQAKSSLTCDLFCCTDNVAAISVEIALGLSKETLTLGALTVKRRSWNFDVSKWPRGPAVFSATAKDAAGNTATASAAVLLY